MFSGRCPCFRRCKPVLGRGRSGGSHDCDLCERASLETAADHGWRVGVCKKSRLCLVEMVWVDSTKTFLEKEKR